jgi:hypothetical protein
MVPAGALAAKFPLEFALDAPNGCAIGRGQARGVNRVVICRLLFVIALGAALSACGKTGEQLAGATMPTPEKPGTNVKFLNPNPNKWVVTQHRTTPQGLSATVYSLQAAGLRRRRRRRHSRHAQPDPHSRPHRAGEVGQVAADSGQGGRFDGRSRFRRQ